jgi:hypothetical protein
MITKRRFLSLACISGLASFASGLGQVARSQGSRGLTRVLVGFPAGGNTDFVARLLANEMSDIARFLDPGPKAEPQPQTNPLYEFTREWRAKNPMGTEAEAVAACREYIATQGPRVKAALIRFVAEDIYRVETIRERRAALHVV